MHFVFDDMNMRVEFIISWLSEMKVRVLLRFVAAVVLVCCVVVVTSFPVRAQSSPGFETLMSRSYESFRSAYWYTRTGNLGVAAIEIMTFGTSWNALREAFGETPPEVYANDPQWAGTLAEIASINDHALELLNNGDQSAAYETISGMRQAFAELRARNGIVSFSDYVNDYDVVIRKLSAFRAWDKVLSDDDWLEMTGLADEADTAIVAIEQQAPADLVASPDFRRSIENNMEALARYREHVSDRNERGAKGSIRDLRSAYGLLFLKYG